MNKKTSIQINPNECQIYEGTICDKDNCIEKGCEEQ